MSLVGLVRAVTGMVTQYAVGQPGDVFVDRRGRLHGAGDAFAGGVAVTPTDGLALAEHRALWIGTGGTLIVTMAGADGAINTITTTVADGSVFPFQVLTVKTATGASGIVAGW